MAGDRAWRGSLSVHGCKVSGSLHSPQAASSAPAPPRFRSGLPEAGRWAYQPGMADSRENTVAPKLFDRALLQARQRRAQALGPAGVLLDRVTEDIEERLHAVMRNFADVADIWTPAMLLRPPLRDRFDTIAHISPDSSAEEVRCPKLMSMPRCARCDARCSRRTYRSTWSGALLNGSAS